MLMDNKKYQYNLYEILCLMTYGEAFEAYRVDDYDKEITEWAEREIIAGNDSETVLILASLNLDKKPDQYEVKYYLSAYMRQEGIFMPNLSESSVVWLRIKTWFLLHVESVAEIGLRLHQIPAFPLSSNSLLSSKITWQYYHLYEELFEDWGPDYPAKASKMSEPEIINYIKDRLKPFYRILTNKDWVDLLSGNYRNSPKVRKQEIN
ncbi:hypothetical protein V462_09780 [Pantoea ananatis 15320]|nr:hypothetical protein V462_09780 [Pantoea ananatis 15320]PQK77473.1 hypothetical protein CG430_10810 [Pantoea ananatis]PQL01589.1 hypothetical protein CG434_08755 [Pantoea ananatis]CRH35775.1 Putative uncharacterized protein [Pantoea ananatis]